MRPNWLCPKTIALTALSTVGIFTFPHSANALTIYVSSFNQDIINQVNATTGATTIYSNNAVGPTALAFDLAGNLYVANHFGNAIRKIGPTGADLGIFGTTGSATPISLAVDSAGDVYAALDNNTIEKYNTLGQGALFASAGTNGLGGIALDPSGNLYAVYNGTSIEKFNSAGSGTVFAATGLSGAFALAIDAGGDVYASNTTNNTIEKFNTDGVGTLFSSADMAGVSGLAFDSNGTLYAANNGNAYIDKYDSLGNATRVANGVANDATGIAIAPVPAPEPSTWMALIVGGGSLVGFRRRRASI